MLTGHYREFRRYLCRSVPASRIFTDDLSCLAYGTDASFYRLIPRLVVKAETEREVIEILRLAGQVRIPLTFRAAGTSLSGQAVTDSVLVPAGKGWRKITVSPDASLITLQPGVIGSHANAALASFGRKIGPDPASINSAMIGGIAANNASGMCCGISQNSYQTLQSMRVILVDGALLDTGDSRSRENFMISHREMLNRLQKLRNKVVINAVLTEKIRCKYKIKNTTGYSLNALVDFENPIDILQHLMIGSEGTLGFIAEITLMTVPDYPFKASSLIVFQDMQAACRAASTFSKLEVAAVELMDSACLAGIGVALLVEVQADGETLLKNRAQAILDAVRDFLTVEKPVFSFDAGECSKLWNIRKGLFPSIGAMREAGTTVIIEDVAFPLERLADAAVDLQSLFAKHGYLGAILFGHALQGNLHFVFTQDFNCPEEVERYACFMDEVTRLVADGYGGSLKAEHGTGRNMAPFVEREWGAEAYGLMKEIKNIFDPDGLLNPGVILNPDPAIHTKNLKPLPKSRPVIDQCTECGFCEPNCPSKDLTLTPRQRIVIFREMVRLGAGHGDKRRMRALERGFRYQGEETCAADGICALRCPVGIDTGKLIKSLRREKRSTAARAIASFAAGHMAEITAVARGVLGGLKGLRVFPRPAVWPVPAVSLKDASLKAVYFPSCISRIFGVPVGSAEKETQITKMILLLSKAGVEVVYPEKAGDLCCGLAFESKGFLEQGESKREELATALRKASENGKHPVLFDTSPCLARVKEIFDSGQPAFYEPAGFIKAFLLERLEFHKVAGPVANHVTCSARKMGLEGVQKEILSLCAEKVIDTNADCCGFAGDKGFAVPELTASALEGLKGRLLPGCESGYSTSLTCETGLGRHGGIPFQSIIYLADRCSKKKVRAV